MTGFVPDRLHIPSEVFPKCHCDVKVEAVHGTLPQNTTSFRDFLILLTCLQVKSTDVYTATAYKQILKEPMRFEDVKFEPMKLL